MQETKKKQQPEPDRRVVKIFDTTLRDGEQSPGMSMNLREKIEMARQLERMGVDIIEAGFAISSPGDFESVRTISGAVKGCVVASLARASVQDIDRAWEAVKDAKNPRIHIFLATSQLHMEYKLKMKPDEVYEQAVAMTRHAKGYTSDVEFSAEDATRSDMDFLARVCEGVIAAGATTVNLPDTVGYTTPEENYRFFIDIREKAPSLDKITISTHCHNDLGLGVANTLAAVQAGVNQVECTVNGIGERAGNAAMEEIVMALHVRKDEYGAETNIDTTEITRASNLLTSITGVKVQPNKAIVGENAFAHEAGIHQHGVMQKAETYEIMTPESVGLKTNSLVLGKHSGKHAFGERVKSLGYDLTKAELAEAFDKFKILADKKKSVYDKDIEAIVAKEAVQVPKTFTLKKFTATNGSDIDAEAEVTLIGGGRAITGTGKGSGPIYAAFQAIDMAIGRDIPLDDFQLGAVTEGEDAQGDATVIVASGSGARYSGRGLSTDIVEASIRAYINAINKMYYAEKTQVESLS
ncbi:MAG: 2-isopropylmalate synthase [Clostridiales Family XIII bacterium]|jgi:2-isopropylmalate synthase|nr:2-isopropylmalate synthase [Clostridiales Family XIII bacterium]